MNSTVLPTVGFWLLCNSRDVLLFCVSSVPTSSVRYPSGCAGECLSSGAWSLLFSNHHVFKSEKEIDANNKKTLVGNWEDFSFPCRKGKMRVNA